MTKTKQEENDELKAEIEALKKRIEELERVVNRTLPRGAQLGPAKIVELSK
jgi:cell division protein FtsB